jgi:predicted transcriptional regulator
MGPVWLEEPGIGGPVAGNIEDEVFEALSNKLRRDIIVLLHDRIELTQKELMDYLGVSSGLLNFHLRKLGGPC